MLTVVVYGNSLALSSIGASLEGHPGLQLAAVDATLSGALERLRALSPDVLVFDLSAGHPDTRGLWTAQPHLLVVGVDLASHRALVISSQFSAVSTSDDLVQLIEYPQDPLRRDR